MSLREFRHWQCMYAHEPWGDVPADRRAAMLATVIRTSSGVDAKFASFLPPDPWNTEPEEMTDDQIKEAFMRCDAMR